MEELQIWKLLKNAIFKTKLSQPEGWLWMAFASASCIFLGNKKMRNHEDTRHVFLISKSCIGYLLSNPSTLLSLDFFPMKDGCGWQLQAHLAFSSGIRRCKIARN
jgi:hypothetical protein